METCLNLASPDDLPTLMRFVADFHEFEHVPHDAPAVKRALGPLLSGEAGRARFIVLHGEPVGYVALCFGHGIEFPGRDAFIDEMFILAEHRGRGVGKAALRRVQTEAETLGVKAMHLEVDKDNEPAQRLCRSVGFEPRARYFLMSIRPAGDS